MILIIKHIDIEGPGTLGEALRVARRPFTIVELGIGEKLPNGTDGLDAVVVLGGPMKVVEEIQYPFLKEENRFIQQVLKDRVPMLGICLGAQLLAKAAGARVVKSPVKEIGWFHIALTRDGQDDPLFAGFDPEVPVYHWHEDMFDIPGDGTLLATAVGCPHQALKIGPCAYGVQFHVEITDTSIREWSEEYCRKDRPERNSLRQEMLAGYQKYQAPFERQAQRLYANFFKMIDDRKQQTVKLS